MTEKAHLLIRQLQRILASANGTAQSIRDEIKSTLLSPANGDADNTSSYPQPRFSNSDFAPRETAKNGSPGDWCDNEDQMTHGGNGKGGNWLTD